MLERARNARAMRRRDRGRSARRAAVHRRGGGRADRPAGPTLHVPLTGSRPVMDGKLDEPCWKNTAHTGPLKVTAGQSETSATEAFILRDAGELYIGLQCVGKLAETGEEDGQRTCQREGIRRPAHRLERDRNSCYRMRITPEGGGKVTCSYNEHSPPWHDRTWQPKFESAVAKGSEAWTAEFALPFDIFCKNKTLASEIGFNVRRSGLPGQEVQGWQARLTNPGDWGILTGIPARESLPAPDYAKPKPDPFSSRGPMGRDHVSSPVGRAGDRFWPKSEGRRSSLAPVRLIRARRARCDWNWKDSCSRAILTRGASSGISPWTSGRGSCTCSPIRGGSGGAGTASLRPAGQVLADHHAVQSKLAAFERAGPVPQDGPRRRNGAGQSRSCSRPSAVRSPCTAPGGIFRRR